MIKNPSKVRSDNAVDFWRGFALVTIFINHIPGIVFERFTHKNYSPSDSAELFIFLAGWTLRLSLAKKGTSQPAPRLLRMLSRRALEIYLAHLLLSALALLVLTASFATFAHPDLLATYNARGFFFNPVSAFAGLLVLSEQLSYFNVLPLHTVLILWAPIVVLVHRRSPPFAVLASFSIYLFALCFRYNVPTWPTSGAWFFNPLAWQFVFVAGYVLAGSDELGGVARRHIALLRKLAWPIVIIGALIVFTDRWPNPAHLPEPRLLFMPQKSFVTPVRLVQFLALVAVASSFFVPIARFAPWLTSYLSRLGRNSLNVFCCGSIMSLMGCIARTSANGALWADAAILVGGLVGLGMASHIPVGFIKHSAKRVAAACWRLASSLRRQTPRPSHPMLGAGIN